MEQAGDSPSEVVTIKTETDADLSVRSEEIKKDVEIYLLNPSYSDQHSFHKGGNSHLSNLCQPSTEDDSTESPVLFFCGGCGCVFDTVCNLHAHILHHNLGGSYHYNHSSRTAFPKHDSVCSESQTDFDHVVAPKVLKRRVQFMRVQQKESDKRAYKDIDQEIQPKVIIKRRPIVSRAAGFVAAESVSEDIDGSDYDIAAESLGSESSDGEGKLYTKKKRIKGKFPRVVMKKIKTNKIKPVARDEVRGKNKSKQNVKKKDKDQRQLQRDQSCLNASDSDTCKMSGKKDKYTSLIKKTAVKKTGTGQLCDPKLEHNIQHCTCVECKLVFESEEFLQAHMQKHEGKLICDCCNETFHELAEFQKHLLDGKGKEVNAVEMFVCSVCNMAITELKGLKAHLCASPEDLAQQRLSVRIYSGTKTKKKDVYDYMPLSRADKKESGLRVQCETCQMWFDNAVSLTIHTLVHIYINKCSKCNLHFFSGLDRNHHYMSCINPDSNWTCTICGKRFNSPNNLTKHSETHKDTKDLMCEMCGKAFKTKCSLRTHRARCPALENRPRMFSCEICEQKFFEKTRMRQHMQTVHCEVRPYVCEICASRFKTVALLNRHKMRHEKDRPAKVCDICGNNFKCSTALWRHRRRHVQATTMKCQHCGKMFHERWNLKVHMRQHTGEKPYKCDLCGQGFTHNVSRKTHMQKCGKMGLS